MNEFQQKQKLRRILYSKGSIVALLVVTVLMMRGSWTILDKEIQSKKNMQLVERQLASAKEKEIEIRKNIDTLSTPEGAESEIRERYSVKKDGEDVVIVVETQEVKKVPEVKVTFWGKVSNWFRDLVR